jgi:hypothetical protein
MKTPPPATSIRRALQACVAAAFLAAGPASAAPRVLGHPDCEKCHKPAIKQWSQTEPAALGGKAHFNTHKQLSGGNASKYADAIGLANPADPKGSCVACHGTVVRGRLRSGVSCETCHGAASDYLAPHEKEPWRESYKKAVGLGMTDLHDKTAAIAKLCVDCHVTPDARLAGAGHPNGSAFDAGASLRKIVHWTAAFTPNQQVHASYDFGQVSGAGRPLVARRLAGGGGGGGGTRTTAAPAPVAVVAAATWDWDAPVAALPADYPSEEARPAPPPPAAPSISEDLPLSFDNLPATEPAVEEEASGPAPAAARLAELRGRAASLLAELLATGKRAPNLEAPPAPAEFTGPDGELLHIQDVVLYLALETLRSRQP